jgi:hypothetical protein
MAGSARRWGAVERLGGVVATAAMVSAAAVVAGRGGAAHGTDTIERTHEQPGPWGAMAVDVATLSAPPAAGHTVYYPADLGAGGYEHPLITWGNGTLASPSTYEAQVFDHLTSWGYVVVASNSQWTGSGQQVRQGVELMAAENADPASPFYRHIDMGRVGAWGHSQGAGGALWAALDMDGVIDTVVTWALPDQLWWCLTPTPSWEPACRPPPTPAELATLSSSVFLIRGSLDLGVASESGARRWYADLPGPAAKATIRRGHHLDLSGTLGYVTAWFRYQLDGDLAAGAAFAEPQPELSTNSAWVAWAGKGLG